MAVKREQKLILITNVKSEASVKSLSHYRVAFSWRQIASIFVIYWVEVIILTVPGSLISWSSNTKIYKWI